MMGKDYQKIFQALGLSDNESAVYELLLSEGQTMAGKIAKLLGLSRTNTYNVLKSLNEKGLINSHKKSTYTNYFAEHPINLQNLLLEQKQSLDRSQSMLTSIIDSLAVDYNLSDKRPGVFRFEGREGLERSYNELLKDGHDIDIIMDRPRFRKFIGDYNDYFVKNRKVLGIRTRVVSPDYQRIDSADKQDLRQVRYLPSKGFPFEIDLKVTIARVVVTTLKEDHAIGITIIDSEIAKNFRLLFELIWAMAK